MNGLPYYKAYPRDFIEGTIGMSFEVKGAYRLILDLIYMQGGNLPDDPRYVSGLLGCSIKKWKVLREAVLGTGKIIVRDGFLANLRADKELETLGKFQDKQRDNRSRPNKIKEIESPTFNHTEPDTEPDKNKEPIGSFKKRGCRLPDDWEPDLPFAVREGLSQAEAIREAEKFRDYWKSVSGQKGVKADWHATWKNWIRKAADSRKPRFSVERQHRDDDPWASVDCRQSTEEEIVAFAKAKGFTVAGMRGE